MAPSSDPADQLRRTFVDLTDEMLKHVEQTSMLVAMGWSGAFGWEELLKSWRTVLISEAGSGKTHECRAEQLRLWDAGEPAFYIELAELAKVGLERLLDTRETERLAAWRVSQSDIATFFLDSIDELELTRGSFRTALTQFANAVAGQLHRVRVVITSRPIPFDQHLIRTKLPVPAEPELEREARAEAFADLAMGRNRAASKESTQRQPPDWRSAALMPLSDQQILEMAKRQGVTDADALLAAIQQDNAQDFARRPQDLIELCAGWRERGRIGTHREQVESNITIKLKARTDRPERTTLSVVKAREGATRLALAALLTRKLSIRHSVESDLEGVPGTALDPQAILDDWPDDEIKTLLERALFGFASYGRVRFHHRSVIEFLTAERLHTLSQRGMSIRAVKRMFFADIAYGPRVVKPTMRPVAAWIALKEGMDAIFDEVLDREPEVLFDHGDPRSLSVERRACILRTYVERYGNGSWRGQHIPSLQVRRFAAPQLSDEVLRLWATGIENTEARELLLDIAAIAPIPAMANIAHASAMSGYVPQGERTAAIKLLIRIDDPRLDAISGSMQTELELWPNRLRKSAALSLVPTHVAADRLCHILASITESPETIFDLGWMLSQKIDESTVPTVYLEALRTELTSLVMNGAQWGDQSSHAVSPKPHLVAPLAVVCRHLLVRDQRSSDILTSSVATIRLMRYPYDHGEMITALRKVIADSPTLVRESTFWADDAFLQRFRPNNDPRRRLFDICHDGSITLDPARDHAWVLAALLDPHRMVDERAMVLEAAIKGIIPGPEDYSVRLKALKPHVADCPSLLATLDDRLKPRPIDPEYARLNEEFASSPRESERREEESHSSWLQFWDDIARDPVAAFSDDRTRNTVWYLWSTMARVGKHSRAEGWNRRFVELNFGKETADRMRNALMVTWRKDRPTLRSERTPDEKGTYLTRWVLGVAAIAAEAEDPHWACRLLRHEAELAARYVPLELNSFPSWLESLAAAHPDAVDAVLGLELIGELDEPATTVSYSAILQHLGHASPQVAGLFLARLRAWLDANASRIRDDDIPEKVAERLQRVVETLLTFGDAQMRSDIRNLAVRMLDGAQDAFFAAVWLPTLMHLDPVAGTDHLEKRLDGVEPEPIGCGVTWIAQLFGERHHETLVNPRASGFTPALLLRLVRLAYRHVRRCDDFEHEGVYTPGPRDHAEYGRNALMNALFDAKGPEAWAAKLELANDPEHAGFRDRLLTVAREKAAEQIDGMTLSEAEVATLDRYRETAPATRDEMFMLLRDRLDDLEDMLLGDASPRAAWTRVSDEREMRQVIAHELKTAANGMYTIDQEAVTADEKETDIRLRTTAHGLEAVIELKLGEKKRSGRELRETLRNQLVTKYMGAENCRVGCLLITVAKNRSWHHPDTCVSLDAAGLQAMLDEEASRIMASMPGQLRLTVRVLDLRPRLSTEKCQS